MRRVLNLLFVPLIVFTVSQSLIRILPGDPVDFILAETGSTMDPSALRKELQLDVPLPRALALGLKQWLHADWGQSLITHRPIAPQIQQRAVQTLKLALLTLAFTLTCSVLLGLCADTRWERAAKLWAAFATAAPLPWIAPLALLLFAVKLPIFPFATSDEPSVAEMLLPGMVLGFCLSGTWIRLILERLRGSLWSTAAQAARARGLAEPWVRLKYGLAPVSGPLLAYLGTQAGHLIGGALITETVFNLRGLGTLVVEAVLSRDYPVFQVAGFWVAAAALVGNALGDWLQSRWSREA